MIRLLVVALVCVAGLSQGSPVSQHFGFGYPYPMSMMYNSQYRPYYAPATGYYPHRAFSPMYYVPVAAPSGADSPLHAALVASVAVSPAPQAKVQYSSPR